MSESFDNHDPCVLAIFGASGDLTRRKLLPALYNLEAEKLLPENFSIVGFSRTEKTDEQFREESKTAVVNRLGEDAVKETVWQEFESRLKYVAGQYDDPESFKYLHERSVSACRSCTCNRPANVLFYLALPPSASETVLRTLKKSPFTDDNGRASDHRILMEKPFGLDLESAKDLNRKVADLFDESQVYRIDHYLTKDTVRNLMVFRFANAIFEPIWNRNYIDNIQITAAEEIGIEDRGGYYEEAGVVRDMLQNHVLQVMSLMAMEPPVAGDEESVRDKKTEIFKSLRPLSSDDFVFGQYDGYRSEKGVAPDSVTPTFAAIRMHIDNWRWKGVPFYIRSGKALDRKITEVVIQFKTVPLCILGSDEACSNVHPNIIYLRIQPEEGIRLAFNAQQPGKGDQVGQTELAFKYRDLGKITTESYERVILDALRRRPALFWRSDSIELAWEYVEPMLKAQEQVTPACYPNYLFGSSGPKNADDLIRTDGKRWLKQNHEE